MASCAKERLPFSDENTLFVGRFVYDVIVYTLPIFGFRKTMLPTTDCGENVYNRANLVKIAGALTLRLALIMRDKWKMMFKSRLKSSEFNEVEIMFLFGQISSCCPVIRVSDEQSVVEECLALCNEMILFCHHESIGINSIMLTQSTATYIISNLHKKRNISKAVEELIYSNHDVLKHTGWLSDFIVKFAIPYGSREDLSDSFTRQNDERNKAAIQGLYPVDKSVLNLKNHVGFLPHDAFKAIALEGSRTVPENLELASWSTLPGDRESPEPPKLPDSSKSGDVARRK